MIGYIRDVLKDLHKLHCLYGTNIGLIILYILATRREARVEIFGIPVDAEQFSLIAGILYGVFISIFFFWSASYDLWFRLQAAKMSKKA
jgi:hypothetical protein